jgi:hypothetical protein
MRILVYQDTRPPRFWNARQLNASRRRRIRWWPQFRDAPHDAAKQIPRDGDLGCSIQQSFAHTPAQFSVLPSRFCVSKLKYFSRTSFMEKDMVRDLRADQKKAKR